MITILVLLPLLANPPVGGSFPELDSYEGLAVRLWVDDNDRHNMYDPLFVRATVKNTSDKKIIVQDKACVATAVSVYKEPFRFQYNLYDDFRPPETVTFSPFEEQIVEQEVLQLPPLKQYDHSFWKGLIGERVDFTFFAGSSTSLLYDTSVLNVHSKVFRGRHRSYQSSRLDISISGRPEDERDFIKGIYAELAHREEKSWASYADKKALKESDPVRPMLQSFGLTRFGYYQDLNDKLIAYESELSPGSLRDIVKLTRLMREMYVQEDPEKRKQRIDAVLQFLDTLPLIQRQVMARDVVRWARRYENLDLLRLVDGAIKRLPEKAYHHDDYRSWLVESVEFDYPGLTDYVKQHRGEDYRAEPEPPAKDAPFQGNWPSGEVLPRI